MHRPLPSMMDHYRLEEQLGAGGMGVVYRALDTRLERSVAIKMMFAPELLGDGVNAAEAQERFLREARAAARIKSRFVAQVLQLGTSEQGEPYIVMEMLRGVSLSRLLAKVGRLPPERVVLLGRQVCRGMQAAHDLGIVHRDLKPANVMIVEEEGEELAKVLDFGVAKMTTDRRSHGLTQTGAVVGTLAFMSPEQLAAEPVDHRTDIYALGMMLYRMFTGANVWEAESLSDIVRHQMNSRAPTMLERVTDASITPALDRVVLRCLEKQPGARWSSMSELGDALEAALRSRRDGSKPRVPTAAEDAETMITEVTPGPVDDDAPRTSPTANGAKWQPVANVAEDAAESFDERTAREEPRRLDSAALAKQATGQRFSSSTTPAVGSIRSSSNNPAMVWPAPAPAGEPGNSSNGIAFASATVPEIWSVPSSAETGGAPAETRGGARRLRLVAATALVVIVVSAAALTALSTTSREETPLDVGPAAGSAEVASDVLTRSPAPTSSTGPPGGADGAGAVGAQPAAGNAATSGQPTPAPSSKDDPAPQAPAPHETTEAVVEATPTAPVAPSAPSRSPERRKISTTAKKNSSGSTKGAPPDKKDAFVRVRTKDP